METETKQEPDPSLFSLFTPESTGQLLGHLQPRNCAFVQTPIGRTGNACSPLSLEVKTKAGFAQTRTKNTRVLRNESKTYRKLLLSIDPTLSHFILYGGFKSLRSACFPNSLNDTRSKQLICSKGWRASFSACQPFLRSFCSMFLPFGTWICMTPFGDRILVRSSKTSRGFGICSKV